jgi:hypothetical protein
MEYEPVALATGCSPVPSSDSRYATERPRWRRVVSQTTVPVRTDSR